MIPHNWRHHAKSADLKEGFEYLFEIVDGLEKALVDGNQDEELHFRKTLGVDTRIARLSILLYQNRGEMVSQDRLYMALTQNPDAASKSYLAGAMTHVRRAFVSRYGAALKCSYGSGYTLTCPTIPELERPYGQK